MLLTTFTSSSLQTETVDPISDRSWNRDVISHPDYTFFHSAAWAKVLNKTYGHEPAYLRFYRNGNLAALLPIMDVRSFVTGRRGISLPFTDFCGPLIFETENIDLLFPKVVETARERKWKHFEIRERKTFESSAPPAVEFLGHTLDLRAGEEELLRRLKSSVRRALRKGERNELKIEVTNTRKAILEFYQLHVQTRKKHGLPPQPLSFFLNIHEHVLEAGLGFVVIARLGSRAVAANVYFHFGKKAIYKFGASNQKFQDLRGSNLAMWEGIRFLAQSGTESLHFGRTSVGNEGLRRYKLAWGTKEEKLEYLKYDVVAGQWVAARDVAACIHNSVFSKLPLHLNRMAGAIIYPHLD
jgi:hypothetical protein